MLKARLEEISKRPLIMDLTSHNFANVLKWIPTLQRFGSPLHTSIVRTLQFYSLLASEALSFNILEKSIKNSSVEEVVRSLDALAQIIDMTLTYLEKRFTNLRDYFWQQNLEDYSDFSELFSSPQYGDFLSAMDQFAKGLTKSMDAMVSTNPDDRENATRSFSTWLGTNMEHNPFVKYFRGGPSTGLMESTSSQMHNSDTLG
jgi:hypothetical protein